MCTSGLILFNINSQTALTVNHTPFPSLHRRKGEKKKVFKNEANYFSILPLGPWWFTVCGFCVWTSTDCSLLDYLGFVAMFKKQTSAALVGKKRITSAGCWCLCGKQCCYPGLSGHDEEELRLNSMVLTSGSERMSLMDVSYLLLSSL